MLFYFAFSFLLCIFIPKIPKILYLSDLTLVSDREGIDNPFIVFGASCLIVCAGIGDLCVVSYWIDTLVLKTEGNTNATLAASPFPLRGKPTQAQDIAVLYWQT